MKSICLFEKFVVMGCPLLPIYLPKKSCLKYFICFVTALKSLKVYMYYKVKNNA